MFLLRVVIMLLLHLHPADMASMVRVPDSAAVSRRLQPRHLHRQTRGEEAGALGQLKFVVS
jgi:hypothetical protein